MKNEGVCKNNQVGRKFYNLDVIDNSEQDSSSEVSRELRGVSKNKNMGSQNVTNSSSALRRRVEKWREPAGRMRSRGPTS